MAGTWAACCAMLQPFLKETEKQLPRGSQLIVRGAAETMHSSFVGLGVGLVGAIALVYLLLVINFQSWLDPFIIICALPGALAGVIWALYLTFTTMSVPALMGAIMSLGVATSNAVLVVTFARNNSEWRHVADRSGADCRGRPLAARGDDRAGDGHRDAAHEPGAG